MQTKTGLTEPVIYKIVSLLFVISLITSILVPAEVFAAQLTSRKLTLGSSAVSANTTYNFNFTAPSSTAVQSFQAQVCTTASGACTTPSGFSNSSATMGTVTGLPGTWSVNNATAGILRASTTNTTAPTNPISITFGNVTNPSAANTSFYARITTYSDTAWTTSIDSGTVAASTSQQITLSGTMDETLVFCVGTSITGQNCGTIAGSSVNFGTFSSSATSSGTSVMAASTNAGGGYVITINGNTLTCSSCTGSPTIAALAVQTAAATNTAQFGLNLKDNATPNVGTEVSGTGSATANANYGTVDQYRFVTGDTVAGAAGSTNSNAFTVSYIVNVPGSQTAGTYSAVMTYIATSTY